MSPQWNAAYRSSGGGKKQVRFNEYDAQNLSKMRNIRMEKEKQMQELLQQRETREQERAAMLEKMQK